MERSYEPLEERLQALDGAVGSVSRVDQIEQYSVYRVVVRAVEKPRLRLLLTGGVHGDEPAGVEAVLGFLEERARTWAEQVEIIAVPCVNPSGYVRNKRENATAVDINRAFDGDDEPEVQLMKAVMRNQALDVHVDCHEDWEAKGFYMYEGPASGAQVGPAVIEAVEAVGGIDPDSGEDSQPLSRGVYEISPGWGTSGLGPYALHNHVERSCIFETPTDWPLAQRVAAHRAALETVLQRWTAEKP